MAPDRPGHRRAQSPIAIAHACRRHRSRIVAAIAIAPPIIRLHRPSPIAHHRRHRHRRRPPSPRPPTGTPACSPHSPPPIPPAQAPPLTRAPARCVAHLIPPGHRRHRTNRPSSSSSYLAPDTQIEQIAPTNARPPARPHCHLPITIIISPIANRAYRAIAHLPSLSSSSPIAILAPAYLAHRPPARPFARARHHYQSPAKARVITANRRQSSSSRAPGNRLSSHRYHPGRPARPRHRHPRLRPAHCPAIQPDAPPAQPIIAIAHVAHTNKSSYHHHIAIAPTIIAQSSQPPTNQQQQITASRRPAHRPPDPTNAQASPHSPPSPGQATNNRSIINYTPIAHIIPSIATNPPARRPIAHHPSPSNYHHRPSPIACLSPSRANPPSPIAHRPAIARQSPVAPSPAPRHIIRIAYHRLRPIVALARARRQAIAHRAPAIIASPIINHHRNKLSPPPHRRRHRRPAHPARPSPRPPTHHRPLSIIAARPPSPPSPSAHSSRRLAACRIIADAIAHRRPSHQQSSHRP